MATQMFSPFLKNGENKLSFFLKIGSVHQMTRRVNKSINSLESWKWSREKVWLGVVHRSRARVKAVSQQTNSSIHYVPGSFVQRETEMERQREHVEPKFE